MHIILFLFCFIIGMHHLASGEECRELPSIAKSAVSVEANSAGGGHVWIYVANLDRKPANARRTESQEEGKTMFASKEDFKSVWKAFKSATYKHGVLSSPAQCYATAAGQNDCVLAKDVGITEAYSCTKVDESTRCCTDMKHINPKFVVFYYHNAMDGKWHLNTAYPADKDPGAGSCKRLYPYVEDDRVYERLWGSRRGGRREHRCHRARKCRGAQCIAKIIKKIMNLNAKEN